MRVRVRETTGHWSIVIGHWLNGIAGCMMPDTECNGDWQPSAYGSAAKNIFSSCISKQSPKLGKKTPLFSNKIVKKVDYKAGYRLKFG